MSHPAPEAITIIEAAYGSPHYHAAVALRQHVLRSPLGMTYTPAQLAADEGILQFVAMQGEQIVGCVMLHRLDNTHARLRQFAVAPQLQGQGVGAQLLAAFETRARALGFTHIRLSARQTALNFYAKHGYHTVGEAYVEIGLPHIAMEKSLA